MVPRLVAEGVEYCRIFGNVRYAPGSTHSEQPVGGFGVGGAGAGAVRAATALLYPSRNTVLTFVVIAPRPRAPDEGLHFQVHLHSEGVGGPVNGGPNICLRSHAIRKRSCGARPRRCRFELATHRVLL